jgi:hypothetical protein
MKRDLKKLTTRKQQTARFKLLCTELISTPAERGLPKNVLILFFKLPLGPDSSHPAIKAQIGKPPHTDRL